MRASKKNSFHELVIYYARSFIFFRSNNFSLLKIQTAYLTINDEN